MDQEERRLHAIQRNASAREVSRKFSKNFSCSPGSRLGRTSGGRAFPLALPGRIVGMGAARNHPYARLVSWATNPWGPTALMVLPTGGLGGTKAVSSIE